jgi:hypothetical protein
MDEKNKDPITVIEKSISIKNCINLIKIWNFTKEVQRS